MNFKGISWAGLYASELPVLSRFYEGIVGLTVVSEGNGFCLLDAGGGGAFELWANGLSTPRAKTSSEQSVIIAFAVQSLEPAMAELLSRGLSPDSEIGCHGDSRWVYYIDPEGNRFELKETR